MKCSKCGGDTKVNTSIKDGEKVLRQRKCISCKNKFYTEELVNDSIKVRTRLHWLRTQRYVYGEEV